ncbi:MAG: hypothetical protein PHI34_05730, partial [Acidobacteriota bacterium]|nr:hypothetical protein [Acidobacteriota bacterium]
MRKLGLFFEDRRTGVAPARGFEYDYPGIILSPCPQVVVRARRVEDEGELKFSPSSGYSRSYHVELISPDAEVEFSQLRLVGTEFDEGPSPLDCGRKLSAVLIPIKNPVRLNGITRTATVEADFKEVMGRRFVPARSIFIESHYGFTEEIWGNSPSEGSLALQKARATVDSLKELEEVPLRIGILASTDKGFTYVADNSDGQRNDLAGVHQVHIDEASFSEAGLSAVEQRRLAEFRQKKLIIRVPTGRRRIRRLAIYGSLGEKKRDRYYLERVPTYFRIDSSPGQDGGTLGIRYREWKAAETEGSSASPYSSTGSEMKLPDYSQLNEIEVDIKVPLQVKTGDYQFELKIYRKRLGTAEEVGITGYSFIIRVYESKELPDGRYVAIDFGTTNTCIAGPGLQDGIPIGDCFLFPLNYYGPGSGEINIIPSTIAIRSCKGESIDNQVAYIPEPNDTSVVRIDKLKIRIPDQLAKTGVFADDPLTRSIEFLEQVIDSLELYFEDHLSDYTTIRRLLVTFPTGFAP